MKVNLYRGRRVSDDKWIIGYYVLVTDFESGEECPVIIPWEADLYSYGEITEFDFVDPTTVGQFTGLVDCNGRKIFEGDVLESNFKPKNTSDVGIRIIVRDIRETGKLYLYASNYRVVGNIHDNPELIAGRKE